MSSIAALWQTIETQYNNGTFPVDQLDKIDVLVFSDDIENIRNGLTLMTTIAPEYLCRYLKLNGDSVVLRDAERFSAPLSVERVLVEAVKVNRCGRTCTRVVRLSRWSFEHWVMWLSRIYQKVRKTFVCEWRRRWFILPAGEFRDGIIGR